jgi:hypothetical protein
MVKKKTSRKHDPTMEMIRAGFAEPLEIPYRDQVSLREREGERSYRR